MNDVTRASDRAHRMYRSPNFRNAYVAGARAAINGRSDTACPYERDPKKTWLKAYRKAWMRGFQSIPRRA